MKEKKTVKQALKDNQKKNLSKRPTIYPYKGNRLMWPVDVYKEWYEYAKLTEKTPKALMANREFKDWFDPTLFAEPPADEDVKLVSAKDGKLTVEIDLSLDVYRIGFNFLKILNKHKTEYDKASHARYQPSKPVKDIKLAKLSHPRKVFALKQEGLSNLEIAYRMQFITKEAYDHKLRLNGKKQTGNDRSEDTQRKAHLVSAYESAVRKINRDVKACKAIITNVEAGTFP